MQMMTIVLVLQQYHLFIENVKVYYPILRIACDDHYVIILTYLFYKNR